MGNSDWTGESKIFELDYTLQKAVTVTSGTFIAVLGV
jgi:hypothetical protein